MLNLTILHSVQSFAKEFERCCQEYRSLHFATAWCGDPKLVLPYEYLKTFTGQIAATVGRSFDHTHPDAIDFLLNLKVDLRIFRKEEALFHPKLYLFSSDDHVAIFIGSSNLTYSGFYSNIELSVLLEGVPEDLEDIEVRELHGALAAWHREPCSFVPTPKWIANYRKAFEKALEVERRVQIETPPLYENEIASASWLRNASWQTFYKRVLEGLQQNNRTASSYLDVLAAAHDRLPLPWKVADFDDLELRRIILGIKQYGWLGHIGAAGRFREMLSKGKQSQRQTIAETVTAIGSLSSPIEWNRLAKLLDKLVHLGPTMKVWSRLLCLVRSDLYCTIASIPVRKNLSETLKFPQTFFQQPAGYIELLKLVHSSPWFNSHTPSEEAERQVWLHRAAFMDAIFYT